MWWVYSNEGSTLDPHFDSKGKEWYTSSYALDTNADQDGDGVNNQTEFTKRTNPYNKDSDGDGLGDMTELSLGLEPTAAEELVITGITVEGALEPPLEPSSGLRTLALTPESSGAIELQWQWQTPTATGPAPLGEAGLPLEFGQSVTYVVEFSPTLENPDWQPVDPAKVSTSSADSLALGVDGAPRGYYRVRMVVAEE